jgi:5-enolpyruvylshikimate-3-phosphate synthase
MVEIDSFADHRCIAMAFGVLGAVRGGVVIDGAECVCQDLPRLLWEALRKLGVEMEIRE